MKVCPSGYSMSMVKDNPTCTTVFETVPVFPGIHAREWIANAVATYMIRELVENYEENKNIVDNLNIHVLPLANPDGYEFSISDVSRKISIL
jgi:murein tripeptide amidase MpaA